MAVAVDRYDCSHATKIYGDRWMKRWTSKANEPGYEEWLFVAWVWGVDKIFEHLFAKAVVGGYSQRVGGGMDKVPVFKGREGGSGFGECVPETVLSSVPIPNGPASPSGLLMKRKDRKSVV